MKDLESIDIIFILGVSLAVLIVIVLLMRSVIIWLYGNNIIIKELREIKNAQNYYAAQNKLIDYKPAWDPWQCEDCKSLNFTKQYKCHSCGKTIVLPPQKYEG